MEWNLENSLKGLDYLEYTEASLWWKVRFGWNFHRMLWKGWTRNRERELTR